MQQLDMIGGFSDLKSVLIQTYNIKRTRDTVGLHFSIRDEVLLMHDQDNHELIIHLSFEIKKLSPNSRLSLRAQEVVAEALSSDSPVLFMQEQFKLCGTLRL